MHNAYISKILTNHALIFGKCGRKTQFIGNFEKIFEKILKKIAENALFFPKYLTNNGLIFCAFGRKQQIVGKF